jgi:hypothetical protein
MSVTYSLNLLAFKVNQIVVWLAGAPLCPGLHKSLSHNATAKKIFNNLVSNYEQGTVQFRRKHV